MKHIIRFGSRPLTLICVSAAIILSTGALAAASPANADAAQQADPNAATDEIPEIIVTAQRRSENIQKVPISITAIDAATATSKGIARVDDLSVIAPAVNVTQSQGGEGFVFIRGVGTSLGIPGLEPPIAYYVDGVYYAGQAAHAESFDDLERIEILKGPQGTLFGRNSTGGVI
ncbi:MAG: TonB-dependent receptor plug domain-containing protein, partial [Methylocella sp.]